MSDNTKRFNVVPKTSADKEAASIAEKVLNDPVVLKAMEDRIKAELDGIILRTLIPDEEL